MKKILSISNTLPSIKKRFNLTNIDLAKILGISPRSIGNYLKGEPPTPTVFNKIISFIENNGLDFFELFDLDGDEYLFHGSRTSIEGLISTQKNPKKLKDFGQGFYFSESFKTAITDVDLYKGCHIYRFKKDCLKKCSTYKFNQSIDDVQKWVLFIGNNRKKMNEKDQTFYKIYFDEYFSKYDLIVGTIADSFNFDVMDSFFNNEYDVFQVEKALKEVNIGNQFLLKNEKIANSIVDYDEFEIEERLRKHIANWHAKQTSVIRENSSNKIDEVSSDSNFKYKEITKRYKEEYGKNK